MKTKMLMVPVLVLLASTGLTRPALANEMHDANRAEFVNTLRQASTELKATNPDLSNKLNDYADKKEKMAEKMSEKWEHKEQDVANLRSAAAQLKATDKNLADSLEDLANRCEKKLK